MGLAPLALFVLLIWVKLHSQRRKQASVAGSTKRSLIGQLSTGVLLALAMAGGAIGGTVVGICLALLAGAEDAGDHPSAVFLFWASVVSGLVTPALWYWFVSRRLARSQNESIDDNEWFNEKGSM
jgi:hypothetical protein